MLTKRRSVCHVRQSATSGAHSAFPLAGVGAILIAPLIKVLPTRTVLAGAVVAFAFFTSLFMIIDAATGGHVREPGQKPSYGSWDANVIFPLWTLAGVAYGMVELIRRVIPADISEC